MRDKIQQGWEKPGWLNYMLLPVSWLYIALVWVRWLFYRVGIFKSFDLPVPVIVVGGISVGGTGKTPLVIGLVRYLQQQGYKPGIISRGYGGNSGFWPREVGPHTDAEMVGDEPQLMYELTDLPVVVGPDRVCDGHYLIDKFGCDILVSDDGFQHYALKRDIDIVVIDGQVGLGNGWCLPAGPLRESDSALKRADIVMVNTEQDGFSGSLSNGESGNKSMKNQYVMRINLKVARNLSDQKEKPLSDFKGSPVNALAGIGNPNRFFNQLEAAGLSIRRHPYPDHHAFIPQDLASVNEKPVLMTEKDGIKCKAMAHLENLWVVPVDLGIESGFYSLLDDCLGDFQNKETKV